MLYGAMLDDGPLIAPHCYHLPSSIDPVKVSKWFYQLEIQLLCEIFTLSSKSILYEMALHCRQRPYYRRATSEGNGIAAMMRFFSETLRCFEHNSLLAECRMVFKNHLEAGLNCVRLQLALERLLPVDGTLLTETDKNNDPDLLVQPASCSSLVLPTECSAKYCMAEEVDREKWVFRDVDEGCYRRLSDGTANEGNASRRLLLRVEAKLAYSITLFLWAAVRLLGRRFEMLTEFPPDHALFTPVRAPQVPRVSSLGDSFETLLLRRKEVAQHAVRLFCQGDYQAALEEFTRAFSMSPEGDEGQYCMYQFRAGCHLHLQQYRPAVEDCTSALRRNPHAYIALYRRASAYEALGELESAMNDVIHLLQLYPGSGQTEKLRDRLVAALPADHPLTCLVAGTQFDDAKGGSRSIPTASKPPSAFHRSTPDDPATPLTSISSSVGALSFSSDQLSIELTTLPAHTEPLAVDDAPHLSAFLESGSLLEYTVCCGKELGRGATGRVYKAVHSSGGWFMAIKEVEAKHLEGAQDLLGALDLMATMKHNNVVRCLGLRRLPGFYHIILEYCSGGSLRSLVNEVQGLSPSLMRKYATEVLRGLRYIHGHGLLHRDIKGGNILLRDDGMAKIADLGTCMRIPEAEDARCDSVKGTVLWMAPETFRGRYSIASDVWSFGCLLIEMATAKDPWHEHQFQEQLTAMVFIATRPDALPAIPPQLGDNDLGRHFFHCCVSRDPSERRSTDLLLRHPWLSSTEPSTPASPYLASPYAGSIQDCFRDKLAATRCRSGFQWTTSSSVTESSLIDTMSSSVPLVESLTKAVQ